MSPRQRLLALCAAAAGLWWLRGLIVAPADELVAASAAHPRQPARSTRTALPFDPSAEVCTVPAELPQRGVFEARYEVDPFTARRREQPVKLVHAPVHEVAVVTPPPPPPPPPPPLQVPYRFLGALNEKGAAGSVFLSLGNTLITAKAGDTLEGGYRLERIAPRELVFLHLQQNQTVRLSVDGEPQ